MVWVNGLWGKLALEFVEVLEAVPYIVRKTGNEKFSFLISDAEKWNEADEGQVMEPIFRICMVQVTYFNAHLVFTVKTTR